VRWPSSSSAVSAPRQRPLPSRRLHRLARTSSSPSMITPSLGTTTTKVTLLRAEKHPANPVLRTVLLARRTTARHPVRQRAPHRRQFRIVPGMIERELRAASPGLVATDVLCRERGCIHWTKPISASLSSTQHAQQYLSIESDLHSLTRVDDSSPCSTSGRSGPIAALTRRRTSPICHFGRCGAGAADRAQRVAVVFLRVRHQCRRREVRVVGDRPANSAASVRGVRLYRFATSTTPAGSSSRRGLGSGTAATSPVMLTIDRRTLTLVAATAFSFARPGQTLPKP